MAEIKQGMRVMGPQRDGQGISPGKRPPGHLSSDNWDAWTFDHFHYMELCLCLIVWIGHLLGNLVKDCGMACSKEWFWTIHFFSQAWFQIEEPLRLQESLIRDFEL